MENISRDSKKYTKVENKIYNDILKPTLAFGYKMSFVERSSDDDFWEIMAVRRNDEKNHPVLLYTSSINNPELRDVLKESLDRNIPEGYILDGPIKTTNQYWNMDNKLETMPVYETYIYIKE